MLAALLFLIPLLPAQPDRLDLPACSGATRELAHRSAFTLCHDSHRKTALWTLYELRPSETPAPTHRLSRFRPDSALTQPSALDSDYRHSGWVRGHLVPAADVASNEIAARESFLLSNAVPQDASLNQGKWRTLENAIRRLAQHSDSVLVLTGPVFCSDSPTIGDGQVAVPCQLYKIAIATQAGQLRMFAFLLPNDHNPPGKLNDYATSVAHIQRLTALDFSPHLAPYDAALELLVNPLP